MTSVQIPAQTTQPAALDEAVAAQRARIIALRASVVEVHGEAISPAVARALETAGDYLFLALGYLGHTDELFPGQTGATEPTSP